MTGSNDLTSVSDVKTWLGLTSATDDDLLAGLVTEISCAILADLGRASIGSRVVTEVHDGGGERAIVLRHWPVTDVLSCTIDAQAMPVLGLGQVAHGVVLDRADPAPPGRLQRLSQRFGRFPAGVQNIVVTYRVGFEVAESAVVPTTGAFTVLAVSPYGPWHGDGSVFYATGRPLISGALPAPGVYSVAAGVYGFSPADAGSSVVLRYSYIPADLVQACREWVAERYAYRARIGQSSKTLGGQETVAFIVKAMPDVVDRLLQPYRRVVGP